VVETKSNQYIVEVKKDADIDSKVVQAKAAAVVKWCQHVTNHEFETMVIFIDNSYRCSRKYDD